MRTGHWRVWLIGCIIALFPLGAWLFARYLVGEPPTFGATATRELLFFGLSITGEGILALVEATQRMRSPLLTYGAIAIAIASAFVYGAFLIGEALHAAVRMRNAYHVSVALASIALGYGALIRTLTREGNENGSELH